MLVNIIKNINVLLDFYVNYDCAVSIDKSNLFEQIINILAKIG